MSSRVIHRTLSSASILMLLLLAGSADAQTIYRWIAKDGRIHYTDQPPVPAETRNMEMKKLKGPNVIDTGGAFSYETAQAAKQAPLTLYTSENCNENCKKARELLSRRGVPYTEKVIRTESDGNEFRAATGSKDLLVPVLKAGEKSTRGYEEGAWNRLLDESGYPQRGNVQSSQSAQSSRSLQNNNKNNDQDNDINKHLGKEGKPGS